MKAVLHANHLQNTDRKRQVADELKELDKKLKTPQRTVEDVVQHMELIKELMELNDQFSVATKQAE